MAIALGILLIGAAIVALSVVADKAAGATATGSSSGVPGPVVAGSGPVVSQIGTALHGAGLSRAAAAGIIGNAVQESSLNPSATDGSGNGGLWGFTSSPHSLSDLQAYARSHGADWTNAGVQTDFLLTQLSPSDIAALNSQSTPAAAASWFMNNWEHPLAATENEARRIAGAVQAYGQLGSVYK
jgi:hypothetical protein